MPLKQLRGVILSGLLVITAASIVHGNKSIGGAFTLINQHEQQFSLSDAKGKIVLLFFGFTHCPDVCPNTLGIVQTVLTQLKQDASQIQPVLITVDPQRDTPKVLRAYLEYFGTNFIGLTGSPEQIQNIVTLYGGYFTYKGDVESGNYTVDHTSSLYVINQNGQVASMVPYGIPPAHVTKIVTKLLHPADSDKPAQ